MDQEREAENLSFGDWVRLRRKALWMTQKKLARLVGCAPVTIQKIEEGHRRPSRPVAEVLAQHLEIGPGELDMFLQLARSTPTIPRAPDSARLLVTGLTGLASPSDDELPLPSQPLIGRERALAGVRARLLYPGRRLLTLTGPPGVGKTRLAVQVAQGLRGAFTDGVYFVPLAALDDSAQVLPTLGRRLGLPDSGAKALAERLARWLDGRQVLLVLDNFEHLLPAAGAVGSLLASCPGLTVLVTSRSSLRLSAEQEWPLEPLSLPGSGVTPLQSPAVQLLIERVRAFDPAFDPGAQTWPALVEIVTRLEGLPLAIELAAVRLRYQSPQDLAARLQEGLLAALGTGPIDGPARQHTLHSAIAWSYQRLDAHLQQVFRRLGVFVGGFESQAAVRVAGAVSTDLERLLDGHLIRREGERFMLLETLRTYALEQLHTEREFAPARAAHRAYYQAAVQAHRGTDLDWYEAEVGNLRVALRTELEGGQVEAALRLALGTYWFWGTRGYQREGVEWFRAILEHSAQISPALRLAGLDNGSTMAWQFGAFEQSRLWLTEAIALSRDTGDLTWEAGLLMQQGKVQLEQGQYPEAQRTLESALTLARQVPLPQLLPAVLLQMADVSLCTDELDRSEHLAGEGLALCQDSPGLFWEAPLLQVLGLVALERGHTALARSHLMRALKVATGTEHRLLLTLILTSLAATLAVPGDASRADLRQAVKLWGCAEATRDHSGYGWSVAFGGRFEGWTTQTRQRLGDPEWALAWAAGRPLPLRRAVADLLPELTGRPQKSI